MSTISSSSSFSVHYNRDFTIEQVQSILQPLFGGYYGKNRLRKIIADSEHIWCVYDRQVNRYVACALISDRDEKRILYVKLFGVDQSTQGRGIGTYLLKSIQQWAKERHYVAMMLHTQINNVAAIGLYEKVGFHKEFYLSNFFRRRTLLWLDPTFQTDAFQMILYL